MASAHSRCGRCRAPASDLLSGRLEPPVELDGVHGAAARGQRRRSAPPAPGPDLERPRRPASRSAEPQRHVDDVPVDQEVLAEVACRARCRAPRRADRPSGAGATAQPTRRGRRGRRSASTTASSCVGRDAAQLGDGPQRVHTLAGSFGRPRRGTGARYGLSVSTSSSSSGTRRAASLQVGGARVGDVAGEGAVQPRSTPRRGAPRRRSSGAPRVRRRLGGQHLERLGGLAAVDHDRQPSSPRQRELAAEGARSWASRGARSR